MIFKEKTVVIIYSILYKTKLIDMWIYSILYKKNIFICDTKRNSFSLLVEKNLFFFYKIGLFQDYNELN